MLDKKDKEIIDDMFQILVRIILATSLREPSKHRISSDVMNDSCELNKKIENWINSNG